MIGHGFRLGPLLLAVLRAKLLDDAPCFLIDVGASGGVLRPLRAFAHCLHAIGFEPLASACRRLNDEEPSPTVRYVPYALGFDGYAALLAEPGPAAGPSPPNWQSDTYPRSSAARAQRTTGYNTGLAYGGDAADDGRDAPRISLDDYLDAHPVPTVDFVKIDTDGHDYEVLLGAERTLRDRQVLGLLVECQFHGSAHPHANVFHNIDRFLHERGFSLFDMELMRYSRGCLPAPFAIDIPAQTETGQVLWADALYLRDAGAPGYGAAWNLDLPPAKLLKLACLFELFGLPDCAADLLQAHRDRLAGWIRVDAMLDLLTPTLGGRRLSFDEYNRLFDADPVAFYPAKPSGE